jgi:hypothetical protein
MRKDGEAMKILMEMTEFKVVADGVECRVWNGVTEDEKQVFVFVHRIATQEDITELMKRQNPERLILKEDPIQ